MRRVALFAPAAFLLAASFVGEGAVAVGTAAGASLRTPAERTSTGAAEEGPGAEIVIVAPPDPIETKEGEAITMLSWNIRQGGDYESVESYLRSRPADVVFLQEVDRRYPEHSRRDTAKRLAEAIGAGYVYATVLERSQSDPVSGDRGQAILSRLPILHARRITLPFYRQPRIALLADLHVSGGRLRVVNVHLENRRLIPNPMTDGRMRLAQGEFLLAELDQEPPVDGTVLAGDFNTYSRGRIDRFEPLTKRLAVLGWIDLFSERSIATACRLRIFCAGLDTAYGSGVQFSGAAVDRSAKGSDHRPIRFNVALGDESKR